MGFNKVMLGLLNSPLHGLLGGSIMSLTFSGRKSGKQYTTPVNYVCEQRADGAQRYWTLSDRERTWWRNLRGGAPVTLGIQRAQIAAAGHLIEEQAAVEEALQHLLELSPGLSRMLHVSGKDGVFDAEALRQAAQKHVIVYFTPQPAGAAVTQAPRSDGNGNA